MAMSMPGEDALCGVQAVGSFLSRRSRPQGCGSWADGVRPWRSMALHHV